jgi:hypothetical protein
MQRGLRLFPGRFIYDRRHWSRDELPRFLARFPNSWRPLYVVLMIMLRTRPGRHRPEVLCFRFPRVTKRSSRW